MQGDFVVPGSPLDDYIALLDQQGLLGDEKLDNATNDPPQPPVKLWPLVKSAICGIWKKLVLFHRGQINHHFVQIKRDQCDHRQKHLDVTLAFLIESDLAQLEQALFVAQHRRQDVANVKAPLELGLLAPVFVAHFVYLVFAEPNSFRLTLHLLIFLLLGYFILLHLRGELITWRLRQERLSLLGYSGSICDGFKRADRLISRSLRLVRDITIIATGHTTVNTTRLVSVHSSALELREAVIKMVRSIVDSFARVEWDDQFEVGLLTYQEQRSAYLTKFADGLELDDVAIVLDTVNSAMVQLEARLESTRRCSQRIEPTKPKANFDASNKASLYRSLSLQAKTLADLGYAAERGEKVDFWDLESHACSIVQTVQLIKDFGKMAKTLEKEIQVDGAKRDEHQTQTSLQTTTIDDKPVVRDDEVLECVTIKNENEAVFARVDADDDEVDEATKRASNQVFTELKSILHLEVNPEKRHKRKQELFPEFWVDAKETPKQDEIIPETSFFSLDHSTNNSVDDQKKVTFESGSITDSGPLLFDDEQESSRRRQASNHDFCCPSATSEQFSIAQLVAARAKKNQAAEFLYGSDSE